MFPNPTSQRNRRVGYALALSSAAAFGTLAVSGRFAYNDGVDVAGLMALRFGFAAAGFWLVAMVRKPTFPPLAVSLRIAALGALVLAVEVTFFFMGLKAEGMTAGLAETVFFIYPAWVVFITAVAHRQKPNRVVILSTALAISGVAMTAGDLDADAQTGLVYLVIASILYAIYVVVSGRLLAGVENLAASTIMTTGTAATLVAVALVGGASYPQSQSGWLAVISAILLGTFAAYALLYLALDRLPSPIVAILTTAEPLVAICVGAALLGERLTAIQSIGGGLILIAVVGLLVVEERRHQAQIHS